MADMHAMTTRRGPKPNPKTRDSLIHAGIRLFHSAGYAATGIQDIVDTAGVPKGSFYNHFESKEAFGKAVVDAYFDAGLPDLRAILQNNDVPPLERLKNYFDRRGQAFQKVGFSQGCLLGNMSAEIADHSKMISEQIFIHFRTWGMLLEDCIAEAQNADAIHNHLPPALLAQFVLNSWEGALLRMRVEKNASPLVDFNQVVFETLLV